MPAKAAKAAKAENAVAQLLAILIVHELVSEALLELRQLCLFVRWVRGCARILLGHEASLRGPEPGSVGALARLID
jgi:hypothetical protein